MHACRSTLEDPTPLNTWHHLATTCTFGTATAIQVYVDGVAVPGSWTTNNGSGGPVPTNDPLRIGSIHWGGSPQEPWKGYLDDLRLFSRILSASEIATLAMAAPPTTGDTTTVAQYATLDLNGYDEVVGALSGSGGVTLGGGRLICAGTLDTIFAGVISGSGRIEKVGSASLTLSAANTFDGFALVSGGTLVVGNAAALGATGTSARRTAIGTAGTLSFNGIYNIGAEQLTVAGVGAGGLGAVYTPAGTRMICSGPVTLVGSAALGNDSTNVMELAANSPSAVTGAGGLIKRGTGRLLLDGACDYSGATTVDAGVLEIDGTNSGIVGSSAIAINHGGELYLDENGAGDPDRIANTTSVTLNGGTLRFVAPNVNRNETINQLVIGPGSGAVILSSTGTGLATLTAANGVLRGTSGGTLALSRGAAAPFGKLMLTGTADTLVLPWSTVTQSGTTKTGQYDASIGPNGLVQTTTGTLYTATGASGIDGHWSTPGNWSPNGVPGANDDAIWNDWVYVGSGTQAIRNITVPNAGMFNQGGTLSVGGVVTFSPTTWEFQAGHSMALDFGTNTGVIANTGTKMAFCYPTTQILAASGLVKTGTGPYRMSGANTYTGVTTVAEGELRVGGAGSLSGSSTIVRRDGVLGIDGVAIASQPLTLDGVGQNAAGALVGRGVASYGGAITLTSDSTIGTATTGSAFTVSGAISGAYGLTTAGTGRLILPTASTYTGATTLAGTGTVRVGADVQANLASPLGTAANVTLSGVALEVNTSAFSRPITLGSAGGRLDAYGSARSLSAAVTAPAAGAGGLVGCYFNASFRGFDEDDWRQSRVPTGKRLDAIIDFPGNAFGTDDERVAFGIAQTNTTDKWDSFSVQWDGWLIVRTSGTTLKTRSDDSSRVWIDRNGNGLIDAGEWNGNGWDGPGQPEATAVVASNLAAGTYRIRVQYEEGNGGNAMYLSWTDTSWSAGNDPNGDAIVPSSCLIAAEQLQVGGTTGSGAGLVGTYFDKNLVGDLRFVTQDDWRTFMPCGTRLDGPIDFETDFWGADAERIAFNITDEGGGDWGNYGVQWDGWITIPVGGTDLATVTDDNSRLWLDRNGDGVVDASEWTGNNWGNGAGQGPTARVVAAAVPAGTYRVRLQYEEGTGTNECSLVWSDATHSAGSYFGYYVVPASSLSATGPGAGPGQPLTIAGTVSGLLDLRKVRTSTATLWAPATYTGGTVVEGGTLALGASDVLPDTTAVDILPGATLDLAGWSDTVAELYGFGTLATGGGTLTVGDAAPTTFAGVVSGSGGIAKVGSGTMTMTGSSTCTGAVTVAAGTLEVDGSIASASVVHVSGGTLAGNGVVGPIVASGGTIAPGATTLKSIAAGAKVLKGILRAGTGLPGAGAIGINLNGPAVTVDGVTWRSYANALSSGLTTSNTTLYAWTPTTNFTPIADAATNAILGSCTYRPSPAAGVGFRLDQTVGNGSYDVSFWDVENDSDASTDMDVSIEGASVASIVYPNLKPLWGWRRYGPFRTTVTDGSLTIDCLGHSKGDPQLWGLLIEPVVAPTTITQSRIGSGATVRIRVSGMLAAGIDYDRLSFGGHSVDISGSTLVLDLDGLNANGTASGILQFGALTGRFANVQVVNNPNNLIADVVYNATSIDVCVTGATNLIAWYKLDETANTFVADSSGNYHHGTLNSGTWKPYGGQINGALGLAAATDGASLDTSSALTPSAITVAFWTRRQATWNTGEYSFVYAKASSTWTDVGWYITTKGSTSQPVLFAVDGANFFDIDSVAPDTFYPLNTWVHIAATFDSATNAEAMYKNGQAVTPLGAPNGTPDAITANTGPKWIGGSNAPFASPPGDIDDVRIYGRVLSAAEIQALYDSGRPSKTWDGGGSDSNWSTAANWVGDVAPSAGDDLIFAGTARTTNLQDASSATSFRSLTFSAANFSLGGSGITLSDGVSDAVGTNTLNLPITLSKAQTFTTASGATTTSTTSGTVTLGSNRLFLDGAGTTTLNGAIGGTGGVTKLGIGTSTLTAANGYTGTTVVSDGTLIVTGAQSASAVSLVAGTLRGSGTVGALSGASGTIADIQPGTAGACGTLKVASADLSAGVTLRLRVTGYSAGQFDVLDAGTASGALTLGGGARLVVDLASLASTGTVTGAVTCASRTGSFNRVEVVNNPNHYDVVVTYGATRIDIKIRPRRNGNVGVFKAPAF